MGRVREAAGPIAQAAAAGIAWVLAQVVLGHPQPVFAPSAAVVALAASVGGRGTQAAEMLVGVAVGVVVGEGLVLVLGAGALEVTLASAAAMLVTATLRIGPLPLIQAGSFAVLVVALKSPSSGAERMLDALVGGVIALLFSQVLFPPSPVSLLKDAGRRTLSSVAEGLRESTQALATGDAAAAGAALKRLRVENLSAISDLAAAREKSGKVASWRRNGTRASTPASTPWTSSAQAPCSSRAPRSICSRRRDTMRRRVAVPRDGQARPGSLNAGGGPRVPRCQA